MPKLSKFELALEVAAILVAVLAETMKKLAQTRSK